MLILEYAREALTVRIEQWQLLVTWQVGRGSGHIFKLVRN
jgi:hypothetical protein